MTSQTFLLVYKAITQGLIIGFCTAALIGPINFMAVRRGILGGFQQTFLVGAGAALVDATCAYAVFSGLLKVGFSGLWKIILWGICAVFLLYLAYAFLNEVRDSPEIMENAKIQKQTQFVDDPFVMGLLLAGSNPFTLIYWIGMVSTLQLSGNIDLTSGAATSFFSAILVSELVWFSCLGAVVHYSRNLFNRNILKMATWGSGILLIFYCCFMAVKVVLNLIHTGGAPFLNP
jgi:threonine/homoserine/homoserine lactone efflux protein